MFAIKNERTFNMIKFKEYLLVILAGAVPFFVAAVLGGVVIEWLFKSDTMRLISVLIYSVLITYPLIKWVFWLSGKINIE